MTTLAAVLDTREQHTLAGVQTFYRELQKLASAPQETDSTEEVEVFLPNLVRESDELMKLLVTEAFAKSKWKKIYVEVHGPDYYEVDHDAYEGDETTLFNTAFRGLSCNTLVHEVRWVPCGRHRAFISCLPPNLRELHLLHLDIRASNNGRGLPELIQRHKHLKQLELDQCQLCPLALGVALCANKSLEHLVWMSRGDMKGFFDSVNNKTLQTLELRFLNSDELGISGIEAMHKAFKDNRLTPQKLTLDGCLYETEAPAVARMLTDYTTIKALDLSRNHFGDDGVRDILSSLQNNAGLRSIDLSKVSCTSVSAEAMKDFVRARRDGTLESARISSYRRNDWPSGAQEEIDTLLDINKLKPLIRESQGVPLFVLQHERLDCTYFFIRSKPEVCSQDVEEPPRKRQKTRHALTSGSWCTIS